MDNGNGGAKLIAHAGSRLVNREELARISTPDGTRTHKTVPHLALVETIERGLADRGWRIAKEGLAVSPTGMRLFGTLDLAPLGDAPNALAIGGVATAAALGFRTSNDKTLSIQLVAGTRVFVCDNMAFAGDVQVLRRTHTRGLSLARDISRGLDRYFETYTRFTASVERLATIRITDQEAESRIFRLIYQGVIGSSLLDDVANNYFGAEKFGYEDCLPRTAWGLHNAATRALKSLTPESAFRTTVALGRHFGLASARVVAPEPEDQVVEVEGEVVNA